jgi:phosphoribosylformylglycinamidine synthase I
MNATGLHARSLGGGSGKAVGVLRFPGTNCDRDVWAAAEAAGLKPEWLWHADLFDAGKYAALFLPGGFSYGDYLRAGALAARAPAMKSVHEAAAKGVPILGICNGFQILCEAGLLPGVLIRNKSLRFNDQWVELTQNAVHGQFLKSSRKGARLRLPVAHADGRYFVEDDEHKRLQDQEQIWFRYEQNPNGSIGDIAGVMNKAKNVAALMPHPERALFDWMGSTDGLGFFKI